MPDRPEAVGGDQVHERRNEKYMINYSKLYAGIMTWVGILVS